MGNADQNQIWRAKAPSNIALIKYMGKTDVFNNRPTNSSLSYTLSHLNSFVELKLQNANGGDDVWSSMQGPLQVELSTKAQARFLAHLKFLKNKFDFAGSFAVRSGNGFPSDCGLASSASSFAALTIGAVGALTDLTGHAETPIGEVSDLSRQGSGSSCRSLFAPWAIWTAEGCEPVELPYRRLFHQVFVIDDKVKAVSSSEAHKRVATSALFKGRVERAEERLKGLLTAMKAEKWGDAFELVWAEFWDMHALFETSKPSFGYMNGGSVDVVQAIANDLWRKGGDGPLVTMDAGPNVHLLYREDQKAMMDEVHKRFASKYKIISSNDVAISGEGEGAGPGANS